MEGARTVGLDNGAMKYTLGGAGRGGAGRRMLTWLLQPASTVTTEGRRQAAGRRKTAGPGQGPGQGQGQKAGAGAGGRGEERVDPSRALCVDPGLGMAGTAAAARHCAHLIQFQGEGRHCRHQRGQLGLVIALFVFLHRHK